MSINKMTCYYCYTQIAQKLPNVSGVGHRSRRLCVRVPYGAKMTMIFSVVCDVCLIKKRINLFEIENMICDPMMCCYS